MIVTGVVWFKESNTKPNTIVRFDPGTEKFQTWAIPSGGGSGAEHGAHPGWGCIVDRVQWHEPHWASADSGTENLAKALRAPTRPVHWRRVYFQTSRAVSATSFSFAHWSSSVRRLPSIVEANPHWGLSARFPSGTTFDACSIRRIRSAFASSWGRLVLTNPRTTVVPRGTNRSGSNVPERSSSYSSRNRSTRIVPNSFSAIGS